MSLNWLPFLLLAGCVPDAPSGDIRAGNYLFSTLAADDQCLDGALEALFMPEGPEVPHPFEFPVYLPSPDATPLTYDVSFRAPFIGMTITVRDDSPSLVMEGAVMEGVVLNAQRYGDCTLTMTVNATLEPSATDSLTGVAQIAMSNPQSSENRCPPFEASPCLVDLTLLATFDTEAPVP